MKKGASLLWKNITSLLSSITKSKSLAVKSKVEAMKARVIIFSLLKNKKKLPLTLRTGSISHKIHALLLGGTTTDSSDNKVNNEDNLQLVLQNTTSFGDYDNEDIKYPDLRHSLFDQEDDDDLDDLGNPNASVIDLVKNSMENDGEDFSLEDEIDHVADLFIMRFHKRMRLQKLESFKRYQEMLERSS
ncbi:putative zinc finger, CCHC-type containing protein [Tanacetum coccineum]